MNHKKKIGSPQFGAARTTNRRQFGKRVAAGLMVAAHGPSFSQEAPAGSEDLEVDYIVVGAGAGGGPVAARLAKAGYTVALLEAGIDPMGSEATQIDPNAPLFYQVPAFLAAADEYHQMSWDFYVKHYSDEARQQKDSKHVQGKGILYPRGSCLGGSSAHNSMIFMYPHDKDWDDIARTTGDPSWSSRNMRKYFTRIENCSYCQPGAPGRGSSGYITSTMADEQAETLAPQLRDIATAGAARPFSALWGNAMRDANHPLVALGDEGAFRTPMHATKRVRISLREHLVQTQQSHPDRLFIITGALASKIILDGRKATGVEYLSGGPGLYEAHKKYDPALVPAKARVMARKEVIISAGVFNTPQLLKLSGLGPASELHALQIPVVADLPGIGANLQDRYEIGVSVELKNGVDLYTRCQPFQAGDPCMAAYESGQWNGAVGTFYGPYAHNAVYGYRSSRSRITLPVPDIFHLGFAIPFHGFYPGFSNFPLGRHWTWLVIKARTRNNAGTVTLRSVDPRQMPEINFRHFDEGADKAGVDLDALVQGVKQARRFLALPQASRHIARELTPSAAYKTDDQLREYIKNEAWGHHASCTAKMGARADPMAVVDSRFRVYGVQGLRVVDACVFPRTPGFFPVAAVMMIGEKAAEAILEDATAQR